MAELETEESFADLFEQSLKTPKKRVQPGEKVTGTIVQVGAERCIVDLGGGVDAIIDNSELAPKGEIATPKKGDTVEAYVIRVENRVAELAKTVGKGAGARKAVEDAWQSGVPVSGKVAEVNKGGYVVEIAGMRAFCPLGQMDVRRIEDPATMLGQHLEFRVTEMRGDRDVLVSRRVLLEEVQAERAKATRKRLEVGARFEGTVTNVRDFGAFVDIGGLEGLVPVSEMAFGRVRAQEVVQAGQSVEIEVLRIEPPGPKDKSERLTFSMRRLARDPWDDVLADLTEGSVVRGTVVRVQPFGAFVEIVPGVDGLLHVSAFGKRVASPGDVVKPGDSVAVRVDAIDGPNRRISLSYVEPEEAAAMAAALAPELAPVAEAPASTTSTTTTTSLPGGLKTRRTEKIGTKAAPVPAPKPERPAPGGRAQVLGKTAGSAPTAEAAAAAAAHSGPRKPQELQVPPLHSVLEVKVDKIETFGLFVSWGAGRGLVPTAELELPKGADLRKAFPIGTAFKAAVIETRPDGKVRLSAKSATVEEERAEANEWLRTQKPSGSGTKGFGTFADLLRAKTGK